MRAILSLISDPSAGAVVPVQHCDHDIAGHQYAEGDIIEVPRPKNVQRETRLRAVLLRQSGINQLHPQS